MFLAATGRLTDGGRGLTSGLFLQDGSELFILAEQFQKLFQEKFAKVKAQIGKDDHARCVKLGSRSWALRSLFQLHVVLSF